MFLSVSLVFCSCRIWPFSVHSSASLPRLVLHAIFVPLLSRAVRALLFAPLVCSVAALVCFLGFCGSCSVHWSWQRHARAFILLQCRSGVLSFVSPICLVMPVIFLSAWCFPQLGFTCCRSPLVHRACCVRLLSLDFLLLVSFRCRAPVSVVYSVKVSSCVVSYDLRACSRSILPVCS